MAISIIDVKGASGNAATVQLAAFAADPAAGDAIVVSYGCYQGPTSHLAPVDTTGMNTYTQLGTINVHSSNNAQSLWLAKNIVGGSTFRVTCKPNNSYFACEAWVLRGVALDPYNGDFSKFTPVLSTTTVLTGQSSPAPVANSIFLAFASIGSANSLTDQAGWNTTGVNGFTAGMLAAARIADYASNFDNWGAYKISSTVEEGVWTGASNDTDKGGLIASFAPLAATGSPALFFAV